MLPRCFNAFVFQNVPMTNLLCNCDAAVASDGIPEIDVFVLSAGWCIDDILSEVASLAAALSVVDELVRETFAEFDSSVCRTMAARTLQARLQDGIARHSAPFIRKVSREN